jgi:hypothetical protein
MQLQHPNTVHSRMLEPQLLDPQLTDSVKQVAKAPNATPIRLLETQEQGDIDRRVLHQLPNGELTEDSVWRWSSFPSQYLDTAIRLEVASNPNVRLVDSARAPALAATLLVWDLESTGQAQLIGVAEFQITAADGAVNTKVVRASEQVTAELPGDLAAAAGRLLHRLASDGITIALSNR